ncbi:flavin reductase [Micromonospora sp. NPDC049580]|uniref:flavin reductase n=1 Tax=Micromonospora sp. NPDC049580 TaxID=3154832 RepID=UPI00342046ED
MGEEPTTIRAVRVELGERSVRALTDRLEGEHLPRRPEWTCLTCEQEWPCDPARMRLAEAYGDNRISLSMYLASLLYVALPEMPQTPSAELHERLPAAIRRR